MTTEELLKPRYKVSEEGYPDMIFQPNQIIELNKWDKQAGQWYWLSPKNNHWYEPFFDRFPSAFLKIHWWMERKPDEMPRYLKQKNGEKVYPVYKHFTSTYPPYNENEWFDDPNCWLLNPGYAQNYSFYLPAEQADFEAYQATLKQAP